MKTFGCIFGMLLLIVLAGNPFALSLDFEDLIVTGDSIVDEEGHVIWYLTAPAYVQQIDGVSIQPDGSVFISADQHVFISLNSQLLPGNSYRLTFDIELESYLAETFAQGYLRLYPRGEFYPSEQGIGYHFVYADWLDTILLRHNGSPRPHAWRGDTNLTMKPQERFSMKMVAQNLQTEAVSIRLYLFDKEQNEYRQLIEYEESEPYTMYTGVPGFGFRRVGAYVSNVRLQPLSDFTPEDEKEEPQDVTVALSIRPHRDFPVERVLDGDIYSFPWWANSYDQLRNDETAVVDGGVTYSFEFRQPQTINMIRFFQDERYCALSYTILGRSTGSADYDLELVVENTDTAPGNQWIEHWFDSVTVEAVRFLPLNGFGVAGRPFPAISVMEFEYKEEQVQSVPIVETASVDLGARLSFNGVTRIHETMFSVTQFTTRDSRVQESHVRPLNLGMIMRFRPIFTTDVPLIIPEDPEAPGRFYRPAVEPEMLRTRLQQGGAPDLMIHDADIGGFVNMRLVTAPPFMRDTDFVPTVSAAEIETGEWKWKAPPHDAAEWGQWFGHIVKQLNQTSDGAIEWVQIWNEPNSLRHFPVPWDQKASRYYQLFRESVPEIKRLNPDILVAGPLITGGGLLGWSRDGRSEQNFWQTWIEVLPEATGNLLDLLDIHTYGMDSDVFLAEAALWANHCINQGIDIIPITSSEGAVIHELYAGRCEAVRWRNGVMPWAEYMFKALDVPDRMLNQTVWDLGEHSLFDSLGQPRPMYWFYWITRNLRGERLYSEISNEDINLLAAINGAHVNIVLHNPTGRGKYVDLNLSGLTINEIESQYIDRVFYDSRVNMVRSQTEPTEMASNDVRLWLAPYSISALNVELNKPLSISNTVWRKEFFGDTVFQRLTDEQAVEFTVSLPEDLAPTDAVLQFGTSGIPYSRPNVSLDLRVPLRVEVNGKLFEVDASKYNTIPLDGVLLEEEAKVRFWLVQSDSEAISPDLFILSASIQLETHK